MPEQRLYNVTAVVPALDPVARGAQLVDRLSGYSPAASPVAGGISGAVQVTFTVAVSSFAGAALLTMTLLGAEPRRIVIEETGDADAALGLRDLRRTILRRKGLRSRSA